MAGARDDDFPFEDKRFHPRRRVDRTRFSYVPVSEEDMGNCPTCGASPYSQETVDGETHCTSCAKNDKNYSIPPKKPE